MEPEASPIVRGPESECRFRGRLPPAAGIGFSRGTPEEDMADARVINVDLAALTREDGSFRTMLAWGDPVSVVEEDATRVKIGVTDYVEQPDGSILPKTSFGFVKRK